MCAAAAEHALGQLLLAHFQREDGAGQAGVGGDVLDDVHGEGGFAHGGAGGDDDHLAVLQAVEHVVEFEEAGLQAAAVLVLDGLEDLVQHGLHRRHGLADFFLGDVEDAFFGVVEHDVGLLVRGVGVAENFVAGGDELPEHDLFADDRRRNARPWAAEGTVLRIGGQVSRRRRLPPDAAF